MNWSQTIERYIEEGRAVSGGKGDSTAQSAEKSQASFTNTLQNAFQTNNGAQQQQLSFLNNKLQSAITNPQGYSPSTLAAMRASANDSVAATSQNVQRSVQNMQAGRAGAGALPSGVDSQINASVASQAAQAGNKAQQDITIDDANLKNQNEWNAVKAEEGVAGLENPTGMAGEANTGASTVGSLSQAVTAANGPGIGSILGGIAGAGLQGWASGGFKTGGH